MRQYGLVALMVVSALASLARADLMESRANSFETLKSGFVAHSTTAHAGKLQSDAGYTAGNVWEYSHVEYDGSQTPAPSIFSMTPMDWYPGSVFGDVFNRTTESYRGPYARSSEIVARPNADVTYPDQAGIHGVAMAFVNVFGGARDIEISGSYRLNADGGSGGMVSVFIYKQALDNATTTLHSVIDQSVIGWNNATTITLDSPLTATLASGEKIFVVMNITGLGSAAWNNLEDGNLAWNVTPEPATLVLLAAGGLVALRRRR